jgi:hypothetical protein
MLMLGSLIFATPCQEECRILRQPMTTALHECSCFIQKKWITEEIIDIPDQILEKSLMGYRQDKTHQDLELSTKIFFDYLWTKQHAFVGSMSPKVLIIALDHESLPIETSLFLKYWEKHESQEGLKICFPLWDLQESSLMSVRELRGKISDNILNKIDYYGSSILLVINGSLEHDNLESRIIYPEKNIELVLSGKKLDSIMQELRFFIIKNYQLPNTIQTVALQANRSFWNYTSLEKTLLNHLEVVSLFPHTITAHDFTVHVKSYWRAEHWALFIEQYPYIKILYHR